MSSLIDEVRARWPVWFGESTPKRLSYAFVARPSASPRRGVVLVGAGGHRSFAAVLKVGLEPRANTALTREYHRMQQVAGLLEERRLPALVPLVLDQFEWHDSQVVVQEFRRGSPIEVPTGPSSRGQANRSATRYVRAVQAVSQSLARLAPAGMQSARGVFEAFAQDAEGAGERVLASEALRLSRLPVEYPTGWQHGDLAPGNLLVHRKQVTVIDWEMARPDLPLFFDLAYADLSLRMMGGDPARINSEVAGTQPLAGGATRGLHRTFDIRGCESRHRHRLALTMTACLATMRARDLGRSGPDSAWWPIARGLVSSMDAVVKAAEVDARLAANAPRLSSPTTSGGSQ